MISDAAFLKKRVGEMTTTEWKEGIKHFSHCYHRSTLAAPNSVVKRHDASSMALIPINNNKFVPAA